MPRDGSNVYHRPSGIDAVTNTTISSVAYNTNVQDVENDLNLPRPIVAGGTGANNAAQAMQNLGGELAKQVVTNYNATTFQAGSFYSATSATGAPVAGHAFMGICYVTDANNMVNEARDQTTGTNYVRIMTAGVWGSWVADVTKPAADAAYVLKAGDTMTGNLTIAPSGNGSLTVAPTGTASAAIGLGKTASGQTNGIYAYTNGLQRWGMLLGGPSPESGSNAGSNFQINRFNDPGALIETAFSINRNDGSTTVTQNLAVGGSISLGTSGTTGTMYFGNTGTKYLSYDGTNFGMVGGSLNCSVNLVASNSVVSGNGGATGAYYFGTSTNNKYIYFDGTTFSTNGGGFVVNSAAMAAGGTITSNNGRMIAQNSAGNPSHTCYDTSSGACGIWYSGGLFNIGQMDATGAPVAGWGNMSASQFTINGSTAYKPGGGTWTAPSDVRIKNVLGDYGTGLDAIAALRPVRFTYKGNDTLQEPVGEPIEGSLYTKDGVQRDPPAVPYANSMHYDAAKTGKEFIGLVAQEAEIPMPELVTMAEGYIDGQPVTDLRNLDTTPLIFALINAVKTLHARIEALEAR